MTDTNLQLWDKLEKTDPSHTKQFTRGGGFKGTAINGTYILKKLTETFGPCGEFWRFVIDGEQIVEGHTMKNGDKTKLHVIRGHLEYMVKGTWHSTSPQFGQTMLVDENKYGPFTDEEAPKKSITDCISKCAVMLGIGADVHLGLFDDNKYVNERKAEEAQAKPVPTSTEKKTAAIAWTKNQIIHITKKIRDYGELDQWAETHADTIAKIRDYDAALHTELTTALRNRFAELGEKVPA